jgi:transforming growth factor-beta-induced protein
LVPGSPVFIPTLLQSTEYTNVTGGQVVQNVKQSGDVVVFVSGQGSRSTLTQQVRLVKFWTGFPERLTSLQDLKFTGGVVQVIDSLLIPPSNLSDTTAAFNLTSFEGALYASNIMDSIANQANVTVFAAANEAFQALGPAITDMTSQELAQVMDYTVIPQIIYSPSLTNGSKFLAQDGENITVLHSGNNVYINSAQLLTADILIANGVLHVIDNVLNPQGPGAQPNPQIASQAPVFASATPVYSLPFTSAIPCTSACPVSSTSATATGSVSTEPNGVKTTVSVAQTTSAFTTSSSKAQAAAMAQQTGFSGAAGLIVALGGAVLMI